MKLARLLPIVLIASFGFGTATVSGKLQNPDTTGAVPGFVQFDLQNCGGNAPTVSGATISPQQKFTLNADGTWSGVMARNDEISCNGSFTTWWHKSYFVNFRQVGPAMDYLCSQASCVFDGTGGLTPITVYPPPTPPAQPLTGAQSFSCSFTAASTWTCTHNFNTTNVIVDLYDGSGNELVKGVGSGPTQVTTALNSVTATFSSPTTGSMYVANVGNWTPSALFPNYIISNPSAPQTITGQGLTLSSSAPLTSAGATTINTLNGEVNVAGQVASGLYSDVCAAISAAPSGTALYLPWNITGYSCAGTATLGAFVGLRGPLGNHETQINCAAGTVCLATTGGNNVSGITLNCNATTTDCWQLKGNEVSITDSYAQLGGNSTILWHVKQFSGNSSSGVLSGNIHMTRVRAFNYTGIGHYIEHVTDVYGVDISDYANPVNTTAQGLIVDTGVSGFQCIHCIFNQNALGGVKIEHTQSAAGSYGLYPNFLFWTSVISDAVGTTTAGDAILFDSTLGTNPIFAWCTGCWAVGHGANGVHLAGGQGIHLPGIRIRSNTLSGLLADNANVAHVEVADSEIDGNNTSNTANLSGIDITAGVQHFSITGGELCNCLDTTGHQKYGWRVTAVNADGFQATGVNTKVGNETNYFLNSNTGSYNISGGSSNPLDNTTAWWDNGSLHVHGSTFEDAAVFNTGGMFPGVAGGSDFGNNSDPWGNLYLGTAATNNFKFQPAATSAARTISMPDPGTNVNLAFNLTATSAGFATATTAGTCVQSTTAVTGATTAMVAEASPVSTPGVGAVWSAFVSSAGNVTINECAVAASAGGTIAFNIRVHP